MRKLDWFWDFTCWFGLIGSGFNAYVCHSVQFQDGVTFWSVVALGWLLTLALRNFLLAVQNRGMKGP